MIFDLSSEKKIPFLSRVATNCSQQGNLKLATSCQHMKKFGSLDLNAIMDILNDSIGRIDLNIDSVVKHDDDSSSDKDYKLVQKYLNVTKILYFSGPLMMGLRISDLKFLTELTISFARPALLDVTFETLLIEIAELKYLKDLNVYCFYNDHQDGDVFENYWKSLPQLNKIFLSKIRNLSLSRLFQFQRKVSSVFLQQCEFKTNKDLESLYDLSSCTKVELWGCTFTNNFTDTRLHESIISSSNKRMSLKQSKCPEMFKCIYQLTHLKELSISEFQIEEPLLCELFTHLKYLRRVLVNFTVEADGKFLRELCMNNRMIKYLSLNYMSKIKNENFKHIGLLKNLRYLSFIGSPSVTSESVCEILNKCQYIDTLEIGCNKTFGSDFANFIANRSVPMRKLYICNRKRWNSGNLNEWREMKMDFEIDCQCYDSYSEDSDVPTEE